MKLFKAGNIFEAFKFPYFVLKSCGCIFFTWKVKGNGNYVPFSTYRDYSLLALSFLFKLWSLLIILVHPLKLSSSSTIIDLGIYLAVKISAFQPLFVLIANSYNRHSIAQIIMNIDWIDRKLIAYNIKMDYRKENMKNIAAIICYPIMFFGIIVFIRAFVRKYVHNDESIDFAQNGIFTSVSIFVSICYIVLNLLIFRTICSRLDSIIQLSDMSTDGDNEIIKTVMVLYDKFHETVGLINRQFSLNLMLFFFICIFYFIFLCFNVFNIFAGGLSIRQLDYLVSGFLASSYQSANIFAILRYSSCVKSGNAKILNAVEKFRMHNRDIKTLKRSEAYSLQLSHEISEVSCGLYVFDWKLAFAIAASLFSNTIILLQFHNSFEV